MRKVYFSHLNINNRQAIHPVFKDTLNNPPEGYVYINKEFYTNTNNLASKRQSWMMKGVIGTARVATKIVPMPTIWRIRDGDHELVHASSLVISDKPWIFDYEGVHCITRFNPAKVKLRHVKAIVRRFLGSKKCKHLIAMSEVARKGFVHIFPELAEKTSVVYPAPVITERMHALFNQRMRRLGKMKKDDPVTFLFAARNFRMKGGYETLEAFKKVHAKYPHVRLLIAGDIPDNINTTIEGVTFLGMVSREDMIEKYYPAADIFVYPTLYDTFGYVILEAMAFGIPCISTNDNVMPEMISEGIDGLLVPAYKHQLMDENSIMKQEYMDFERLYQDTRPEFNRMVSDIANAMEKLIENPELIQRMGRTGFEKVNNGVFSMHERSKRLKDIYDAALN